MTLLILFACAKPEPPVPARGANTMDTASFELVEEREVAVSGPRIKSLVLSGGANASQPIQASVNAVDPEDGRLRFAYTWFVNGVRVQGQTQAVLPASVFKKGDTVNCEVEVRSAQAKAVKTSGPKVIGNSPPVIDVGRMRLDRVDGLKVLASDPDGDSLTFTLDQAPPGMTIDQTGTLHFSGSKEQTEGGTYRPRITVSDSHGEGVAWDFELNLEAGKGDQKVNKREPAAP